MGDKKRKKDMSRTGNTGGRNASISDAVNKVAKEVTKVATQKVQAPASKGNTQGGTRNNTQKTTSNKTQNRVAAKQNAGKTNQNRTSFSERMNRYSAPSRKEMNAQAAKPLKNDISGIVKGTAKRYAGQQLYGANDTANDLMDYFKKTSRTTGGDIGLKAGTEAFKFAYDNTIGKSNENLSRENIKKSMKRKGGELQESGQKDIEDVKKGKSNVGKFGVDLASTGMELGLDALLTRGRGTTAAMYNRAYGGAKKAAADEGANEEQAKLYGKASGLLEMGTEKMFSVAKPLQKLYGKGAGDDITETLLQKVTSKMAGTKGKNAVYHGGKTLTAAITEGLEEMVSEGLEPEIANRIYAEAVGKPHETSAKDIAYAGLLGGTMGGILGGGGQIVEYGQGRQVQEVFGEDGVKELAHKVKESDEDSGSSLMGAAIEEMINAGDSIVAGQARMLYQAAEEQNARDIRRSDITRTSADAIIQKENLVTPTQIDSETGQELLGKATARTFDTVKTKAVDVAVELQMPELNSEQISDAVAKIQTGVAGVNEVNLFTIGNPKARTIYEVVTGKSLPKTNKETRETLYEQIALNRINAARAETESYVDRVKGVVQQNMSAGYESAGQRLFASEFGDVDVRDASQVEAAVITFDDFYRAGRNSIAYNDVIAMDNSIHQSMPESMRKAAWEAGQQDKILASDNAKGMQTVIGKTAKETRSNGQKTGSKGKLISELSPEMKEEFTASQQTVLRALARSFNINIHVMDSLENNANGMYVDGEVYLSMSGDRALPYIFAHEITHHMQSYAPKEYNQLKELVRQNWASRGGIDEAVDTKVAEYARHNVKLSREDALDEIIADSTYEMLQDEEFVDELCKSRRNIAQAVLDAINNVLDKLRAVLAEGEGFTPAQNENLLSQLDILKDFERIWANGLARAAENSDAVGNINNSAYKYQLIGRDADGIEIYETSDEIKNLSQTEKKKRAINLVENEFSGRTVKLIKNAEKIYAKFEKADIRKNLYGDNRSSDKGKRAKLNIAADGTIYELAEHSRYDSSKKESGKATKAHKGITGWDYFIKEVAIDGVYYTENINVRKSENGEYVYAIYLWENVNKKGISPHKAQDIYKDKRRASTSEAILPSANSISETKENDNKKFSLGYHAGDLGKSESLANQSGGRSTGHFGTGTYFVGNKEQLKNYNKRDGKEAPVEEVDFDNYNLYKPADTKAAYALHDFLKGINDYYSSYGFGVLNEGGIENIMSQADDLLYEMQENGNDDIDARMFLEGVSGKDFSEDSREDIEEALYNFTNDRSDEISRLEEVAEFNETIPEMSKALGIDEEGLIKKVVDIKGELEGVQGFEARRFHDSASTMFMKSLGYEGVDVRHTKLDNTAYGSVIYDLKGKDAERKAEIGTARFSFAGENALNKDNEMLRKAKDMYNDFEDSETIRKETGWHLGADGKWRFEIDDSQMEVFAAGDALFRREHPEYARLQELYDKFWGEGVSEKEQKEMEALEETWGDEYARLHKRLESGNARLVDVIQHDVLFENYPQLENVKVKIENLDGANGAYAVNGYEIKIDKELFKSDYRKAKRNATLVHEIQHAIQDIEKFAKGANLEMLDTAIQRAESEVENAEELYEKAADNLTDILDSVGYYEKYGDYVDITSEDEQQRIRNENIPGANEALDNFNDYREKYFELANKSSSLENMSPVDFYKYSAGEVEARDAGERAAYNAAEREAVRPDIDSPSIITEDYIRYSIKEDADISYESLVSKPDMEVVHLSSEGNKGLTRQDVVKRAINNVQEVGHKDEAGRNVISNIDTGREIVVGRNGIEHGMNRKPGSMAAVADHIGEYVRNAIKINGITPRGNAKDGYILLGYGMDDTGASYPVYFVIETLETGQDEIVYFDNLYSANAKKIEAPNNSGRSFQAPTSISTISISDLLDIVNEMYSDILPKSVAEHYGNEQRETKLGESVKYSMPDPDLTNEYINDHETEFIEVPPVRDYERRAAEGRVQSVGELQKQVERLKNEKKLTHGKILDTRSVREEMNKLVRTLMSRSEGTSKKTNHKLVDVGMDNISSIYRDIVDGDYASAANTAWYTAKEIVENLEFVDDTLFYEYKDLRDYLRTTKITLSEQDKAGFTDFKEFRGANMGRLRIVNNGGMAVDDVYESLCEKYPGLFDYEITHPVDQLKAMADVRESLEPYDIMLNSEEMEQLTKQAAQDIIDIAAEGKPWKSFADRKKEVYEQRLKQSKARHKEAMHELREVKNDELRRKLQKERDKKNEAITKEREKRKEAVAREKQKHKDYKENQKSRREHAKHYGRIFKNYKWLADRLVKPTDDKHIPEEFRTALAHMLQHFDFQTERSKALEEKYGPAQNTIRMYELKARFEEIAKEDGSGMFEYDGYIFDLMKSLAIKLDGKSIDQASNEDLAAIDTLLKAITTNVRNYNKAFSEEINMTISDLAQKTIASNNERVAKHGKHADRSGIMGGVDSILNESMVTPRDFFEQVGGGLQDAFMAMRKGFDKHVDNLTKTRDFFDEVFKPYNKKTRLRKRAKPGSEVEKWRDSTMLEEIKLESGKTIKMNPAQMMTLYCSMKREQARGHILGSGIVVSKVDNASKIKRALGAKMQTEGSTVMISMSDANNIISRLTEEQIEMADKLQSFLNNECAEWGNEVSMKMHGYRKFTEKEYFPIKSADAYLDSNFEGRQPVERIRNFGFTKSTVEKANNPIMIDDIFRVVSDHINKMSLYNAFAAPISDFTRVYNYKERDGSDHEISVKSSLKDTYGKKVINYIEDFMADVNNTAQTRTEGVTRFVNNSLAAYKKSIIGGNLRVALQQPTAVMRAFMLISPKYFVGGNVNVAKNLKDMMEHCQIARWKSWGHNQVDMARDIDEIMMNNEWGYIDAVTMEIYGALDNTTWSTIWAAVRKETKSKHPDVKENSEEFYQICNERASEIFDKTQVVDSVFHRSQVMRNTDIMSKMVTSFMAEPTRTFNMMRTEYVKAREMWNGGDKAKAVIHANKATSIFALNAALVSAAAAVADVLRERAPGDDEDDTSWLTNFLANFWDNVNPINMIPVAKDIWGFKDGWGTQNMALEGYEALVQSVMELATAEDKAEAMRKVAEGLGLVTGLPVKNVLREVESISKLLGINVFAAEGGEETVKEEPGFLDKLINSFNIVDGTPFDNVLNRVGLNRTEAEQRAADEDKKVKSIERSIKGLSGEERQDKIWSEVTDNYTNYIKDGDFDSIRSMRSMLVALGGDVDKFDESVQSKMETALKKSLGENIPMVQQYKNYLMSECGMTEGKINQEVIMKSETAKNFQLAACTNDEVNMILAMADLYAAGLTDSEIDTLYATRSSAVKGRDFSTGEFAYPVSGEITSTFGYRDQPTAGATTYHEGIDIGVPLGSDVAAADGGKVSSAGYNSGLGYYVKIDHGNNRYTTYAHLSGYFVNKGDAVTKGQRIALSGSTGVSTGPHLHFAVQENGTYVDPMGYFN